MCLGVFGFVTTQAEALCWGFTPTRFWVFLDVRSCQNAQKTKTTDREVKTIFSQMRHYLPCKEYILLLIGPYYTC